MKILVCVKQVPDLEGTFRINSQGTGYDDSGVVFRMNAYDEYAVEEAIQIKERLGTVEVTALSVGPPRAEHVVRRALEFGIDHGVHSMVPDGYRLDALQTASLIASYARDRSFDLLLFGIMSEDCERCQTGPMVAALLHMPCATIVAAETISDDRAYVMVERELEGRRRQVLQLPLPAVLTIQSGINRPRYPSLSNKLRARKQPLEPISYSDLSTQPQCEDLVRAYLPPHARAGIFIEGTVEEQAERLVQIIHQKSDVL